MPTLKSFTSNDLTFLKFLDLNNCNLTIFRDNILPSITELIISYNPELSQFSTLTSLAGFKEQGAEMLFLDVTGNNITAQILNVI